MFIRALVLLCSIALTCLPGKAQVNINVTDSLVQKSVITDNFEGTVLIAENGKSIYHEAFGYTDDAQKNPVTKNSKFGIASITKMLTAILILQLIEENQFELTDPLNKLLPEYDIPDAGLITVHHLLLHISGLPNESDLIYSEKSTPREFVTETLMRKGSSMGTFNYANIDYVLLGLIIEKFEGISWQESLKKRILERVYMTNTGFLEKGNYPDNFAYTFSFNESQIRKPDPLFHIENYYAAGSMYSTANDLLRLDQAMYGNQLLSEKNKELLYTSYPEYNYSGYSVWTYNYPFVASNPRVMERRGGIKGANVVLIRMLDSNKTVIILSNNDRFNPDTFGNTESLRESLMIEVGK